MSGLGSPPQTTLAAAPPFITTEQWPTVEVKFLLAAVDVSTFLQASIWALTEAPRYSTFALAEKQEAVSAREAEEEVELSVLTVVTNFNSPPTPAL
eukprot:Pgem_evm2s19313